MFVIRPHPFFSSLALINLSRRASCPLPLHTFLCIEKTSLVESCRIRSDFPSFSSYPHTMGLDLTGHRLPHSSRQLRNEHDGLSRAREEFAIADKSKERSKKKDQGGGGAHSAAPRTSGSRMYRADSGEISAGAWGSGKRGTVGFGVGLGESGLGGQW